MEHVLCNMAVPDEEVETSHINTLTACLATGHQLYTQGVTELIKANLSVEELTRASPDYVLKVQSGFATSGDAYKECMASRTCTTLRVALTEAGTRHKAHIKTTQARCPTQKEDSRRNHRPS